MRGMAGTGEIAVTGGMAGTGWIADIGGMAGNGIAGTG